MVILLSDNRYHRKIHVEGFYTRIKESLHVEDKKSQSSYSNNRTSKHVGTERGSKKQTNLPELGGVQPSAQKLIEKARGIGGDTEDVNTPSKRNGIDVWI